MSELEDSSSDLEKRMQWSKKTSEHTRKELEDMGYTPPELKSDLDPEAELDTWLTNHNDRIADIKQTNQTNEAEIERHYQERLDHIDKMRQQEQLEKEQLLQRIDQLEEKVEYLMRRVGDKQ